VTCRVVCISHATGAGGEDVGRLVADRLGFLYVDEEIIAWAAAEAGIDPADVADVERRRSLITRAFESLGQGGGDGWVPPVSGWELSGDDLRTLIRDTVAQTVERGNAVIVAHAASHAVGRSPEALRVLVTASPDTRATRVCELKGLDETRARRVVKDEDSSRRDYLKRFYAVDQELPTHYDLVVNTDVLSVEQAAQLVAQAASS
jgi:cytidylate kinase